MTLLILFLRDRRDQLCHAEADNIHHGADDRDRDPLVGIERDRLKNPVKRGVEHHQLERE